MGNRGSSGRASKTEDASPEPPKRPPPIANTLSFEGADEIQIAKFGGLSPDLDLDLARVSDEQTTSSHSPDRQKSSHGSESQSPSSLGHDSLSMDDTFELDIKRISDAESATPEKALGNKPAGRKRVSFQEVPEKERLPSEKGKGLQKKTFRFQMHVIGDLTLTTYPKP